MTADFVDFAILWRYDFLMDKERIKAIRLHLGLTQQEFAELLHLTHKSSISLLESGLRNPRGPLLFLLRNLEKKIANSEKKKLTLQT